MKGKRLVLITGAAFARDESLGSVIGTIVYCLLKSEEEKEMGTYVLVHGAAHGSWCWYKIAAKLETAGQTVIALNLPGHGVDRTPLERVTFQAYVQRVCEALEEQSERVTLVGHSMGGSVISQVAEDLPHKIRTLVYLASPLLTSGESLMEIAVLDSESEMGRLADIDSTQGVLTLPREGVRELFYHDCDSSDIALAQSLLTPQPLAPFFTPVQLTKRYESVRRVAIETCQDRVVGIAFQRLRRQQMPCDWVCSLNSSHFPFFSHPDELVQSLMNV